MFGDIPPSVVGHSRDTDGPCFQLHSQMGRFDRFLNPGVAEVVGGGPAEAFHGHRADVQRDVTVGHVLMDGPTCEPGETQVLCAEVDVGLLGLGIVQGFLDQGFSYLPF